MIGNNHPSDIYTIKDLENLSGIKAHTLRIWEQRYSIIKPSRTDTNIRFYNAGQLKKILNVALLNKYGYKISVIDKMSDQEIALKITGLTAPEAQYEKAINNLIKAMADLDMDAFEEIAGSFIAAMGVEKAILQVIYPFLEKVGMLWLTGHINPAQEHLTSNIIRQKLIMAIENVSSINITNNKVLLFLPEGEYHEITLLFLHYLFKQRGVKVIYLGCSIPLHDVAFVANAVKPGYIYTHLTNSNSRQTIESITGYFAKTAKNCRVVISGRVAEGFSGKARKELILLQSLEQVLQFVKSL